MRSPSQQQTLDRSGGHFALWALASVLFLMGVQSALAQTDLTPEQRKSAPVYLEGDTMSGHTDLETVVQGSAFLRKADTVIRADRLDYYAPTDQAKATGNVHINRSGNIYEGPLLELKLDTFAGFFQQPSYHFV